VVVIVDVVVDAWVIVGKEITVMEVVDEDYLMVVEEDCLMNVHNRFDTYHQLGFDHRI